METKPQPVLAQGLSKWTRELQELEKNIDVNFFRPENGKVYRIFFVDEGTDPYEKTFEDGNSVTKVDFLIQVGDVEYTWGVTRGGANSLYGKLVKVFQVAGRATGTKVTLLVKGEGKERRYTVKEYDDILIDEASSDDGRLE